MARGFKDRLTYKATPIQVTVPASSANLGPGFDVMGLALELRDIYVAQILDEEVFDVDVTGEGAQEAKLDGKHLVIKSMMRGFEFMGGKPRGIALRALNQIPHGKGLGSSAAAIVGGLNLADIAVASGILNHRLTESDNYTVAESVIRDALKCCRTAVAMDFLSDRVDYQLPHTFHFDPCRILEIAYRFSRRVVLRNDYLPFEFAVVIFRDDAVDRTNGRFAVMPFERQGTT